MSENKSNKQVLNEMKIEYVILPRLTLIRYQAVKHLRSFLIHMSFSLPKKTF